MALAFTSTDVVNFGSAASLDDLFANDGTAILWVYPDSTASVGAFLRKNAANVSFRPDTATWQFLIGRATQTLRMDVAFADVSTYGTGKWCAVAATWDAAGANGDQQLWHGDLVTPFAEAAAYSIQRVGVGAVTDTSALDLLVGNRDTGINPFPGKIGWIGLWNTRFSLAELQSQQFRPRVTSGCVLFSPLGYNGTGTQPDFSGNGNVGTVTGATVADHVPLTFRRSGALYVPYAVGGQTFTITPAGVLVPTGALIRDTSKVYLGGATPAGFLGKLSDKAWAGSVTPTGAEVRDTSKNVAGSAGSSGSLIRGAQSTLTGVLDLAGAMPRLVEKTVSGSVALAGSISHAIAVVLSGVLTPIGTLAKDVSVFFSGALTPSGSLTTLRAVLMTLAGSIGLSGAITRLTDKGAGGALAPSGNVGRDTAAILRGSITPVGSLSKLIDKFWSGVVGLAGTLAQVIGLVSPPTAIEITGSYIPALTLTGSYQPALSVTGNYSPALTITGAYET